MRRARIWRKRAVAEWLDAPELQGLVTRSVARYEVAPADVQDLLQETRLALWHIGLETEVSNSWIARTAKNKAIDHVRQRVRARSREKAFALNTSVGTRDPELEHLLRSRSAALPPPFRRFYGLFYIEGRSERDVARELHIGRASVRWMDRCCRRLLGNLDKP
jgi:RNA polymerase sigma factor (sigma-70 family)